jgi:hypothetical protein
MQLLDGQDSNLVDLQSPRLGRQDHEAPCYMLAELPGVIRSSRTLRPYFTPVAASFPVKLGNALEAFLAKSRNTFSGAGVFTGSVVPDIVPELTSLKIHVGDTRAPRMEGSVWIARKCGTLNLCD